MNPGDQRDKRKAPSPTSQPMASSEKDKKKERITPLLRDFGELKANVIDKPATKEEGQQDLCTMPHSSKQNNTQVVQTSLLSQQAIQASTRQVMARQILPDGSVKVKFNGSGGNSYSHHVEQGGQEETVFATSPLPRSGVAMGEFGFRSDEEYTACLAFFGNDILPNGEKLLLEQQIREAKVANIAFCVSTGDRLHQSYKYVEKQHFMRWLGKAIDRVHDIDEHKKSQLSQSVFYQRWCAELTSIPQEQLAGYLNEINNFYISIGVPSGPNGDLPLFGRLPDAEGDLYNLTFKEWWETGHPTLMENDNYELFKTTGINTIKNQMVDGLVSDLNKKGCGFVLPIEQTEREGFVFTVNELTTSDEESVDAKEFNKSMDTIGLPTPSITSVLFSHASALKSTEKTDTVTYERIDALKRTHQGQMPTHFYTMDGPASQLDAGPKKKLAPEKTRKYPGNQQRRSLLALKDNGSRLYDMATMTNRGIIVERQSCGVASKPILAATTFVKQIDTAWSDQINIISTDLNTAIQEVASVGEKVTVVCTLLTTGIEGIFAKQLTKQYTNLVSLPLWNELKILHDKMEIEASQQEKEGKAARDRTLAVAKQLTKIAENEGCLKASAESHYDLLKLPNNTGRHNYNVIVRPRVQELYNCVNVLLVRNNGGTMQIVNSQDQVLSQVSANDQARLQSLITFVTTLEQPSPIPPLPPLPPLLPLKPPLFLTKVNKDENGKFYVSSHSNRYYPLGILPPELFEFTIGDELYLPVEIINALEACFRWKVSNGVYDKLVREDIDNKTTQEINRMAEFLRVDVTFNGSEEFTDVLTSRMMAEDRNNLSKHSVKTARYTQRSNLLNNVSMRGGAPVSIVTASPTEVVNVNIAAATDQDIFIDALTNIMPIRMDTTPLPEQARENNLYTVIKRVVHNTFLLGRNALDRNNINVAEWNQFAEYIEKLIDNYLKESHVLSEFLYHTREGSSADPNVVKKELEEEIFRYLMQILNDLKFMKGGAIGSSGKPTYAVTDGWTKRTGYSKDFLGGFVQQLREDIGKSLYGTTFPQIGVHTDPKDAADKMINRSGAKGLPLLSGGPPGEEKRYIYDAKHHIEQSTASEDFPLLKVIIEEMDEDSRYVIGIMSEVYCIQLNKRVQVPFAKPASVKMVRIKMFKSLVTFLNILKDNEDAKDVVKQMYLDYATHLRDSKQLTDAKYQNMAFDDVWNIFLARIDNTAQTADSAAAVKDDNEDDTTLGSSSDITLPIISPNVQIFGRHFDGISIEQKHGDEAPHILKNVIKDFACQLLQLRCGLGGPAPKQGGLLETISPAIQDAAIQYILEDLAAQKGKTTGDYVQKVEVQLDNLLWSTDWQTEFNRTLHISGFGSFDRIATILAAIDDVPTICLNSKGVTIGVGGINYVNVGVKDIGKLKDFLGPDRLVRVELMSSIRDLNWMIPGEHIPLDTLPYIRTILVLKTLWMDIGGSETSWDQNIGPLYKKSFDLDIVASIINTSLQQIIDRLSGNSWDEKTRKFIPILYNKKLQLDIINKSDSADMSAKCYQYNLQQNLDRLEAAKQMRDNIFQLITNVCRIEDVQQRILVIKQGLSQFPATKKGGGSRKRRRRRRRKTRRKKKRRKRKSIKKRRKRGRKTRRK